MEHKKQNIFQRALGSDKSHQSSSNNGSNKMKVKDGKIYPWLKLFFCSDFAFKIFNKTFFLCWQDGNFFVGIFFLIELLCLFLAHTKKSHSQDASGTANVSDKRVTLRAVRNFMKIGRSRHSSKERDRDSSTEDEGR